MQDIFAEREDHRQNKIYFNLMFTTRKSIQVSFKNNGPKILKFKYAYYLSNLIVLISKINLKNIII